MNNEKWLKDLVASFDLSIENQNCVKYPAILFCSMCQSLGTVTVRQTDDIQTIALNHVLICAM
jgi:hypothetical protein